MPGQTHWQGQWQGDFLEWQSYFPDCRGYFPDWQKYFPEWQRHFPRGRGYSVGDRAWAGVAPPVVLLAGKIFWAFARQEEIDEEGRYRPEILRYFGHSFRLLPRGRKGKERCLVLEQNRLLQAILSQRCCWRG
jgi:hypothetical protein